MWIHRIRFAALFSFIFIALETIAIMVVFSSPTSAHEAIPARIDVSRIAVDRLAIQIDIPPAEFLAKANGADHEDFEGFSRTDLLSMISERPELFLDSVAISGTSGELVLAAKGLDEDGRFALVALDALASDTLTLRVSETLGPALVTVSERNSVDAKAPQFVQPGDSLPITLGAGQPTSAVFVSYVVAGFDHILPKGLDHILFVIGLFLLTPAVRPLVVQVGLFTLAHTITLGLAATGWINISPNIVEPLIAASIAFVAIENLFRTSLSRWRPWVVFGFGLLHGLGFAGVLSDFGLPADQFAVALVAFNIGVEIGQLTVLAMCFAAVGLFFARTWYRRAIAVPASIVLAGFGILWFVERVSGALA